MLGPRECSGSYYRVLNTRLSGSRDSHRWGRPPPAGSLLSLISEWVGMFHFLLPSRNIQCCQQFRDGFPDLCKVSFGYGSQLTIFSFKALRHWANVIFSTRPSDLICSAVSNEQAETCCTQLLAINCIKWNLLTTVFTISYSWTHLKRHTHTAHTRFWIINDIKFQWLASPLVR